MNDNVLEITNEINEKGICRFFAKGRIDSNNADLLLAELEKALQEGQKAIVLNMSRVEYLSSIGIRVILKIFKQASEMEGKFNIERPSNIVKNVLGMLALKELLVTN
jgi:anti-anti-sigma factor